LEGLEFFVGNWFAHQHRDAFWKHGSVDENYSAIQCPVYIVGGWVDPYNNAVARLLTGLKVPRKALIGPWGHGHLHAQSFPLHGRPGPGIDWLSESLRWWDYWLKGIDTGIMREPLLRVWMPDESAFQHMENVPGRWVAEDVWPSPRIRLSRFYLNDRGLEVQPRPETVQTLSPHQTVGVTAPVYFAYSPMDFPADQRIDDARSLTFDSAPLDTAMEILGTAIAHLDLSVDEPVAFLIARLDELTVDGVSRRVTYQVLNLCHREGHESPTPLEPGRRYRVRLPFRDIAHAFKRGSRVRVSISSTSWPMIWPSPRAVNLKLYTGGSMLELPVRPPRAEDATLHPFGPAVAIPNSGSIDLVHQKPEYRTYEWNVATGTLTIRAIQDPSRSRLIATGTEMSGSHRLVQEIRDDDPTSARLEHSEMLGLYRPGWDVRVETMLSLSVTEHAFMLTGQVKAFDHGNLFFSRKWEPQITRNLV
jgi:predicted acyl esterase